jgi:hypothetical protein
MGTGFIFTIHSHRPHCTGLRWTRVDTPPAGGTQIINPALVRLLSKNPSATTGESEWHSLGLERPQVDSFVRSNDEDPTYYRPVPEDARETRFLCTISAPPQSRLQALVEMWDRGRQSTLRAELIQGRDLIVMQPVVYDIMSQTARLVGSGSGLCHPNPMHRVLGHGTDYPHGPCLEDLPLRRSRAEPNNAGSAPKPKTSIRFCPPGAKRRRTRKVSPELDMGPYRVKSATLGS